MSQPPELHPARVAARGDMTPALATVELDVAGGPLEGSLEHPGQFVQLVAPGDEPVYLAVASPPGQRDRLEFLVKRGGRAADRLLALPVGALVRCSRPLGPGFPVDEHEGHDLLMFAGGSGIAALRPALLHALDRRERYGDIHLFFGARRAVDFAYAAELDAWREAGVRVHQVVSRPEPGERWRGATGYVQDLLELLGPDPNNAVALLCGAPGMEEAVQGWLEGAGMPASNILRNH